MGRRTSKVRLTPLQNRITWALREAGSEQFRDLLNELTLAESLPGARLNPTDDDCESLLQAIHALVAAGRVGIEGLPDRLSVDQALRAAMADVRWDALNRVWRSSGASSAANQLELTLEDLDETDA